MSLNEEEDLQRYDEAGNRVDNLTYTYGSNNRLTSVADPEGMPTPWDAEPADYTYDDNGNVTAVKRTDGSHKFKSIQYDSRDLPVFVEKGDGTEVIYGQDPRPT